MSITTSVETFPVPGIEHDCPYVDALLRRKIGDRAITPTSYDLTEVRQLHTGDECPPTHTSPTSPTKIWSDWVHHYVTH